MAVLELQGCWFVNTLKNSIRIKRAEPSFGPAGLNVAGGKRHVSDLTIEKSEMLLTYSVCTATVQLFDSLPICRLKRTEYRDITGLKFVGCMGGKPAEDDVVLVTELQYFKGFVRTKPIIDEDSWSTIGP
jgi:hypothetical protein